MKVIIAGGRDFVHYRILESVCDDLLKNEENIIIVSGRAPGADKLGERYARFKGYQIDPYPAPWKDIQDKPASEIRTNYYGKYWIKAGFYRNEQMAKNADMLIAFWDGKSRGTKSMINIAKENNLIIHIIKY